MLYIDKLPTWLGWLLVLIQFIIAVYLLINHARLKDKFGVWGQIGSVIGIIVTVIGMYHTLPVTKYIFSFAPVEYHAAGFNEGYYYGWWRDGMPQGFGHLTYDNFGDGETYSLVIGENKYRGLYYEGEFDKGYRYGHGTVVYEGGYMDKGTFYGMWSEGMKVFEGKRWLINDTYNCYYELEVWATGPVTAEDKVLSGWISE